MTSRYNINETVYFLHGQKIMAGHIIGIEMQSKWEICEVKTTENYNVEFDAANRGTYNSERIIAVSLLHPSREALIESL